ncbi:Pre-mRNA-processing factor 19 [Psilocybe cubensis]|uniref:Pre-mRNA-processing factor 19 n=2 Tax=Psilocybe cubensis TaxID=181762 RepID=A0ACB8HH76_PSICU|nr:Pre-mRNA-processing factor 19 [Psilocybe cubensis]KAH9487050.1 Pre-mRNA-processing factor 19 [Psilocybe cubensis]
MFCAISGEPPQTPVISKTSGHLYEKRLITKYINENGTDPITGEKLEEADLIEVKASPNSAAPRPPTHTSIPALLQLLSNEWDAVALSMYNLEQKYNATRQELSYALYSQDAASRVIARLIRERDAAREALANVSASMGIAPTASAPTEDVEMVEDAGLPASVVAKIDEVHQKLSASRKQRKNAPPPGFAASADVKTYVATHTVPSLHSASPAGITSLAISQTNPSQFLTGGNDKIVQLYDQNTDKVLASLKGHTKKVNHVAFREQEGENTLLLSAGADKIAKVWAHDTSSGEYLPKLTVRTHKGELTGLAVHPTSTLFALSSTDKTYSLHDLNTFTQVFRSTPFDDPFTSLGIHPDGTLIALGTPTSTIQIYDIRSGSIAAVLTPTDSSPFTVHTLAFSQNGYHLLAPDSLSSVAVWDLRYQTLAKSIPLGDDCKVNHVACDLSGQFLGVATNQGARIFAHKTWNDLLTLEEGGEITNLAFGPYSKEIWGVTGREVRTWGLPAS